MRGKRARAERRAARERAAAVAAGTTDPTREERLRELRSARAESLAELNGEYHQELAQLRQAFENSKAAIEDQYRRKVAAIDLADDAELEDADRKLGIVVAGGKTDLDEVAKEFERVTGRRVAGR